MMHLNLAPNRKREHDLRRIDRRNLPHRTRLLMGTIGVAYAF